jgi:NAD(P)-dependent dehydrogenase (short-subunit alcohol dehydrogenase family)
LLGRESLAGREVVLAGGTGGLGSATAALLLEEGARLVLGYRERHDRVEPWKSLATVVQGDLGSESDRGRLLDAAPSIYGLVVFAGDPSRVAGSKQLEAAMHRSHEINFLGPIMLAREAAIRMRDSGTPGAIVLLSTMQANALFSGSLGYASQKAALQHGARILAKELRGPANIRVNVVSPGVIAAGMAESSIASGKYDKYLKESVVARFGLAVDVARAVRFLLEPDNYVTGQVLCVDGGMTL